MEKSGSNFKLPIAAQSATAIALLYKDTNYKTSKVAFRKLNERDSKSSYKVYACKLEPLNENFVSLKTYR